MSERTHNVTMTQLEQIVDTAAYHALDKLRVELARKIARTETERCAVMLDRRALMLRKIDCFSEALELENLAAEMRGKKGGAL